jgi:hypothetical protein
VRALAFRWMRALSPAVRGLAPTSPDGPRGEVIAIIFS